MKTLDTLHVNDSATVTSIEADEDLKRRFFSFGVRKGCVVKVKAISIKKSTIEIEVGGTMLALRNDEAKTIKVSRVCEI